MAIDTYPDSGVKLLLADQPAVHGGEETLLCAPS